MAKNSPEVNQTRLAVITNLGEHGYFLLALFSLPPHVGQNIFEYILCCRHRNSKSHIQLLLQAVDSSQDLRMKGRRKAGRIKDGHS